MIFVVEMLAPWNLTQLSNVQEIIFIHVRVQNYFKYNKLNNN